MVSIEEYCKNPQEYQDSLPAETVAYYNDICKARKGVSNDWEKRVKKMGDKAWDGVKGVGEFIPQFLGQMIEGILTPDGLKMLAIFEGVSLTSKIALNAILRAIAKGVGDEVMEAAAELATEAGAEFVSNAILTTAISQAVEEGTAASLAFEITSMTAEAVSVVAMVFMIVQLLGMIFDAWDPEGYNKMLDADIMEDLIVKFDQVFEQKFLSGVTGFKDSVGRPMFANVWPIEYYADSMIMSDLPPGSTDVKQFDYHVQYFLHLQYNSDGYKIIWPRNMPNLIDNSFFNKFATQYALMLGNSNTVVANWFKKYWIILAVVIIALIILLLVIK